MEERDGATSATPNPEISGFGSCCDELRATMSGEDFEALIAVGPDNVLYMSVGIVELDDEEPSMVDHPLFFCPFCGTRLQTPDEVAAKSEADITD